MAETTPPYSGLMNSLVNRYVPSFEDMLQDWGQNVALGDRLTSHATKNHKRFYSWRIPTSTVRLEKDGGDLLFRNGLIKNTNSLTSSIVWKELYEGMRSFEDVLNGKTDASLITIPMSPVLRFKKRQHGLADVWTRYSGISTGYYMEEFLPRLRQDIAKLRSGFSSHTYEQSQLLAKAEELAHEIESQRETIGKQLALTNIEHGHGSYLHGGNLTLEFVDPAYVREMGARGLSINTMPFDAEKIQFSARDYFLGKPVQPVVRLIDYSEARYYNPNVEKQLLDGSVNPSIETLVRLLSGNKVYEKVLAGSALFHLRDKLPWTDQLISLVKSHFASPWWESGSLSFLKDPNLKWSTRTDVRDKLVS